MVTRSKTYATAILAMAVLLLASLGTGCVTPRSIDSVKEEIGDVKVQNAETQRMVARIDTTVADEAESNRRLRADMTVTIDQLQMQIATLQENYNDLLQRIDELYRALSERRLLSSEGSSTRPSTPPATKPDQPPPQATPDIECQGTYDQAFVLMRQTEYEEAIAEFEKFIAGCPDHELVENAHFWIGESLYSLGKYTEAVQRLEQLINNFKASPNIGRALYKLGRSKEELGQKNDAKVIFQRLIDEYPGTLEAEQAKERLKQL